MPQRPQIGVSRCLLGDAVRYDGKSTPNLFVIDELSKQFELIAVCPEVEAGLSIPRPPVQLTGDLSHPRLTGRDDPNIDVTDLMLSYCQQKPATLGGICGFIFKSRSPSCGLNSTPVFINGECVTEASRGVFARAMCMHYPDLPVIDDTELENGLEGFVEAVRLYAAHL